MKRPSRNSIQRECIDEGLRQVAVFKASKTRKEAKLAALKLFGVLIASEIISNLRRYDEKAVRS